MNNMAQSSYVILFALALGVFWSFQGVVSVDLIVSSEPWVDGSQDTTLTCSSSTGFAQVNWRKGIKFNTSSPIVLYNLYSTPTVQWYDSVDQTRYTFDETSNSFPLTIKSVQLDDEGRYWCQVIDEVTFAYTYNSSDIAIRVPPNAVAVSYLDTLYSIDSTPVSVVAGSDRQFTCEANGIKPEANFRWTYNSSMLKGTQQESTNADDAGLFNSSNMVAIDIPEIPAQQPLKCSATNRQDESTDIDAKINIMLQVKVPPKGSLMSLYDSSMELVKPNDTSLPVDEGTSYTITCKVKGTRPAVSIQWMVDGAPHQAPDATHSDAIGLIDTQGMLTFTPTRDNHRKNVTCTANTTESQSPYPFVRTALDVTGPPDTPMISGNPNMTENVTTSLNCTAGMGYPKDWVLMWSIEDTAIENPLNTTAVRSGTSQRYNFISQLEFVPQRQDNTHIIKCIMSSPSWTSKPLPEKNWVPINVQYETNITNKHQTDVGVKSGLTANLTCTAKGNPEPVITWFNPNKTEIISGGNKDKYMVVVSYTTSNADMTIGKVTTSKLTIQAVDAMVDYGVYTCNSSNSIGHPDTHEIILNGTRRPNQPTGVVLTDRTSSSIAVRWTAGYDGGEPQWFHVSHKKTADSSETGSERVDGGVTTYNATGLESYTEYEIKVYAENDLGRNPSPGRVVKYTLPESITEKGITIEFYKDEGKVKVTGVKDSRGCIQLEVKYESSKNWTVCVKCITADSEVVLAGRCPQTNNRSRRAVGDVVKVQAKYCKGSDSSKLCSDPVSAEEVSTSPEPTGSDSTGIIVGGVVGGIFLLVIIGILIVYLKRTSPDNHKPTYTDTSSIELATNNFGQNGEVNEGLQSSGGAETNARPAVERMVTDTGDTYAIVKKDKSISKPPPQNLPDVTNAVYAAVNKKTPVSGLGKKPKKYVPPSRVNEESEYDDVKLPQSMIGVNEESEYEDVKLPQQNMKSKIGDAEEDDYANLDQCQTNSGRTVDSDGLIYMEVGHLKTHPANQPPIQTEESTTYASIDFKQLVPPDVARK